MGLINIDLLFVVYLGKQFLIALFDGHFDRANVHVRFVVFHHRIPGHTNARFRAFPMDSRGRQDHHTQYSENLDEFRHLWLTSKIEF